MMIKINKETALNHSSKSNKSRKVLMMTIVASIVASAASVPANAAKYRHNSSDRHNASFDYARVIKVRPIVETYQVNHPQEQCWNERVPVRSHYNNRNYRSTRTKTPQIVGAIIGGIIGNQVGKRGGGNSRDVATVAGAVLGGSIGRDTQYQNSRHQGRYERSQYQTVQRCEVTDNYVTQQEVVGYKVKYKYNGEVFHTQVAEHPGKRIKVRVSVRPL